MPEKPPKTCALFFNEFEYKADTQAKLVDCGAGAVPCPTTPQFVKTKRKIVEVTQEAPPQEDTPEQPVQSVQSDVQSDVPNCNHNEPAQRLEVRKEGKNQGREFYACRRPPGHPHDPETRCNFFKWADQQKKRKATTTSADTTKCHHGLEAKKSKVRKEGRNQGKMFYHCSHPKENCNFFAWADK
jgi:hypothetical protein